MATRTWPLLTSSCGENLFHLRGPLLYGALFWIISQRMINSTRKGSIFRLDCVFVRIPAKLSHLLVTCQVSKQLWLAISSIFGVRENCTGDFRSLILNAIFVQLSSQLKILRNAAIVRAVECRWNNLWLESDSSFVVHMLKHDPQGCIGALA